MLFVCNKGARNESTLPFIMYLIMHTSVHTYIYRSVRLLVPPCTYRDRIPCSTVPLTRIFVPSLWKMTTRPPLSPVAKNSPSWLNSTVEIMSAEDREIRNSTQILNTGKYIIYPFSLPCHSVSLSLHLPPSVSLISLPILTLPPSFLFPSLFFPSSQPIQKANLQSTSKA